MSAHALPGLWQARSRCAACRRGGQRVRAALSCRCGGAVGPQPRLAPRCRGVLRAAVRRADQRGHGRHDLERVSDALAEPDADLLERVRRARALNMDETGWRTAGERRALWGAFTDRHAVVRVRADRHEDHARELLADTSAIVTSDRWWAYSAPAARSPPGLLGAPPARLQGPRRGARRREGLRRGGTADLRGAVLELGDLPAHPRPQRAQASHPRAAPRVQADPAHLRRQAGPLPAHARDGAQPAQALAGAVDVRRPRASSRPTTTPNAPCAARSSTASCPSAPSPTMASGASNGCSRCTPPAASSASHCTTTSSTPSPPTPAAIPCRSWPEPTKD